MWDVLKDTIFDLIKMLPFLFATYLFIEYIEHSSSQRIENGLRKYGVIGGAVLGCFPQCGFSVAASNLFAGRIITTGTLVAVFISTSDEAIPVLIANPGNIKIVFQLIIIKVIFAIFAGLMADIFLKTKHLSDDELESQKNHAIKLICTDCGCDHGIIKPALKHTLNVFVFIFITTLMLNAGIELVGQEKLSMILLSNSIFQPAIAAAIGLIPNCAASVILTQLYLSGSISFGSIISGLSTGAGIGLIVLFKVNNNIKENLKIITYIYIVSTIVGIILQFIV